MIDEYYINMTDEQIDKFTDQMMSGLSERIHTRIEIAWKQIEPRWWIMHVSAPEGYLGLPFAFSILGGYRGIMLQELYSMFSDHFDLFEGGS